MPRRTTGTLLLGISALLYSTRYLSAAIFGSSLTTWNAKLFNAMLQSVGTELVTLSLIALIAGLAYLVWAEIEAWRSSNQDDANLQSTSLKLRIDEVNCIIQLGLDRKEEN
jgi:hypothetical protein